MATYKTAPNLGKPPKPYALTKRARKASARGAAAMREAALSRRWGTKAELEAAARREAAASSLATRHPLPPHRFGVDELTGSAKSLAKYALDLGFAVYAARTSREVEVRIGRDGAALGRAVFREGRLVHAFALVDGSMRKRTPTALKTSLAEAAA